LRDLEYESLRRGVVVALDRERRRTGLAVPEAELGEIDARRVLHRLHEIVTGDRLAVVPFEVQIHAAAEALLSE
jgi:hypothetical protein